jgi:D-3-phosphoglycerate dehydrogenase / 2-oxoglutarate reductase
MRILNTLGSEFATEAREVLETIGTVDFDSPTQDQLKKIIGDYEVLVIGIGLVFDKEVLEQGIKLKAIATATTGLDHIDLEYAKDKGIKIISLHEETEFLNGITGTAELAFALMLDLLRNVSTSFESVKRSEWGRNRFKGHTARGKTLGIIGFGRLGKMMARYAKAFEMNVVSYDPELNEDEFTNEGVTRCTLESLLLESDVVSLHVHLLPETENLIGKQKLAKMKHSAVVINTSRGKIIDEIAMLEALEKKKIGGYATDVLADELTFIGEIIPTNKLIEYSKRNTNCIITPHIGGMTYESRRDTDIFIAEKLKNVLN